MEAAPEDDATPEVTSGAARQTNTLDSYDNPTVAMYNRRWQKNQAAAVYGR